MERLENSCVGIPWPLDANQTPEQKPAKDRERYAQLEPFWHAWQATSESKGDEASAQRFRWLLEEFRVSLFAQDLGTAETRRM
ncbi:MAG: DUF3418 domain-containing protein [Gammaproteobacteria bacterium]